MPISQHNEMSYYGEQSSYDLAELGLRDAELRGRFDPHERAFRDRVIAIGE